VKSIIRIREGQLVKIKGRPLGLLNILRGKLRFPISKNLDLFSDDLDFDFERVVGIAFKRVKKDIWIVINHRGGHIWMLVKRKDLQPISERKKGEE